jgi:aconitate hydratase
MDIDLYDEPLGEGRDGRPVYLKDVWPSSAEVAQTIEQAVQSDMFRKSYAEVFEGDERWNSLEVITASGGGARESFAWDERSTYVRKPPFFEDLPREPEPLEDIIDARVLAILGATGPRPSTSTPTTSRPGTSTPTARAAATTR